MFYNEHFFIHENHVCNLVEKCVLRADELILYEYNGTKQKTVIDHHEKWSIIFGNL